MDREFLSVIKWEFYLRNASFHQDRSSWCPFSKVAELRVRTAACITILFLQMNIVSLPYFTVYWVLLWRYWYFVCLVHVILDHRDPYLSLPRRTYSSESMEFGLIAGTGCDVCVTFLLFIKWGETMLKKRFQTIVKSNSVYSFYAEN